MGIYERVGAVIVYCCIGNTSVRRRVSKTSARNYKRYSAEEEEQPSNYVYFAIFVPFVLS